MKQHEMIEGPEAFTRFTAAMKAALSVPHSVIQQRIAEYRKEADANPRKRGAKRKVKPAASPALGA